MKIEWQKKNSNDLRVYYRIWITIKERTIRSAEEIARRVRGGACEAQSIDDDACSIKQAKYDITPTGHYGLAAEDYTHFTSFNPSLSDLIVHRMVRHYGKRQVIYRRRRNASGR